MMLLERGYCDKLVAIAYSPSVPVDEVEINY
jgi:hypothetical protein